MEWDICQEIWPSISSSMVGILWDDDSYTINVPPFFLKKKIYIIYLE